MNGRLVVAMAISLLAAAVTSAYPSGAYASAAQPESGCPGRLGPLRLTSSSAAPEGTDSGELKCIYQSKDFARTATIRVAWVQKSAAPAWLADLEPAYCLQTDSDAVGLGQHSDKTRSGSILPHAGELYVLATYVATEDGPSVRQIRELGRQLVAEHRELAATCPTGAEPGADIDDASSGDVAPDDGEVPASDSGVGETAIVVSGSAADAIPGLGTRMDLSIDEQHALVVGGADGTVIREEFIGTSGVITGFGPLISDADGNWSVLVIVDVSAGGTIADVEANPGDDRPLEPSVAATPGLPATAAPPATTPPATATPTSPPTSATATADPTTTPLSTPTVAATSTPGTPVADRDLVESDADAAKAVQQVAAHIEALGELVENSGSGKTRIPATDIEALIALAPDLASKIRVGSGSIIVTTYLGDVLVTPDIDDESGLIEVHLSKFAWATNEPIVRELIRALNSGVDGRDARFQMISVTPDGIVLEARARSEDVR